MIVFYLWFIVYSLKLTNWYIFLSFSLSQLASTSFSYMRVVHVLFLLLNINKVYLLLLSLSASNARVKLSKQIGLAMAVHHLMGSKVLITLLNCTGHCSSYSEVQEVDSSLAMEVAEQFGTVVPSNISPCPFIQFAANNNDLEEGTLDGKNTTHTTTMVYQRKQFGPKLPPTARADHTIRRAEQTTSWSYNAQKIPRGR